ncbi:MAG: AI-2E family transporter [Thermoguttaceae bacterium]|nr:AI-2E family transporter [Thermoguttaceae bacterium]
MKNKSEPDKTVSKPSLLLNYSVITAAMVVILAGLHAASSVLGPFLMAAFFAVLLISPVHWFQKRGVSGWLSLTIVIFGVLIIGGGAATLIGSQIAQFARDIPQYRHRFISTLESYNLDLGDVIPFLKEDGDKETEPETQGVEESEKSSSDEQGDKRANLEERANRTSEIPEGRVPELAETRLTNRKPTAASVNGVIAAQTLASSPSSETAEANAEAYKTFPVIEAAVGGDNAVPSLDEADNLGVLLDDRQETTGRLTPPKTPEILKDGGLFSDDSNPAYDDEYDVFEPDENNEITTSKNPAFNAVKLSSQQLFRFIGGLAGELSYFASTALIITLLLVFMLIETAKIPRKLVAALGERKFSNTHMQKVVDDIRHYMAIKTEMSLLVGILVTILMFVSKVQYPLLWGFVAFLLNYIPNIGSVVAAIPPVVLATVEHGLVTGCVDAVFFVAINCIIGYVLEPKLLGQGLDLSPLIVLISLIFFGWLLGPVGMFLSPPLAVIMKIIFQSFPETRWIAALMANSAPKEEGDDEDDDEDEREPSGAET